MVGLLFLGSIGEGDLESVFKFGSEDLIYLGYVAWWEELGFQVILLFFCPVINLWSSNEQDGKDDMSVGDGHGFLIGI